MSLARRYRLFPERQERIEFEPWLALTSEKSHQDQRATPVPPAFCCRGVLRRRFASAPANTAPPSVMGSAFFNLPGNDIGAVAPSAPYEGHDNAPDRQRRASKQGGARSPKGAPLCPKRDVDAPKP